MGVMPGLIGLLQATEAIKLIAGLGRSLDGRLLVVDALSMRFRELSLSRDAARDPSSAWLTIALQLTCQSINSSCHEQHQRDRAEGIA